jgi:hypothetical protein
MKVFAKVLQDRSSGAALMPPSPLWGGIQGGGATRADQFRILRRKLGSYGAKAPPPLTPPHKGEGIVDVGALQ